jgi:hypothetical protein
MGGGYPVDGLIRVLITAWLFKEIIQFALGMKFRVITVNEGREILILWFITRCVIWKDCFGV